MSNFKIIITPNLEVQTLSAEYQQAGNVNSLEVSFEVETKQEEEILSFIAEQIMKRSLLKELTITISKYSQFKHFEVITKAVSYLICLKKLSIQIKKETSFTDFHLIDLTKSIIKLEQLTELKIILNENNKIQEETSIYLMECIKSLTNLKKLHIEIDGCSFFTGEALIALGEALHLCSNLLELTLFLDLKKVNFINVNFVCVSISSLSSLSSLEFVVLNFSKASFQIDQFMNSISNLKNLKRLSLRGVNGELNLTQEQVGLVRARLSSITSLESLELTGLIDSQSLSVIVPENVYFKKLKELKLSIDFQVKSLLLNVDKNLLSQFPSLEILDISNASNQESNLTPFVSMFVNNFSYLSKLQVFRLNLGSFSSSPSFSILFLKEIRKLINLRVLELQLGFQFKVDEQCIHEFAVSLNHLQHLESFSIQGIRNDTSDQSRIVQSVCLSKNLEELIVLLPMLEDQLLLLPNEIQDLTKLKRLEFLDLSFKEPEQFQQTVQCLSKLVMLQELIFTTSQSVSNDKVTINLENLGDALQKLVNLETVYLSLNQPCSIKNLRYITEKLKNSKLKELFISQNQEDTSNDDSNEEQQEQDLNSLAYFSQLTVLKLYLHLNSLKKMIYLRDMLLCSPNLQKLELYIFPSTESDPNSCREQQQVDLGNCLRVNSHLKHVKLIGEVNLSLLDFFLQYQNLKTLKFKCQSVISTRERISLHYEKMINNVCFNSSLIHLDIENDRNMTDYSQIFKPIKNFRNLKSLRFVHKDLTILKNEELCQIGESLSTLEKLETLELILNLDRSVKNKSLATFSEGLQQLKQLTTLNFKILLKENIDGFKSVVDSIKCFTNLRSLTIVASASDEGCCEWFINLGHSLSYLHLLEILSLECYSRKQQNVGIGIEVIGNSLTNLKYLQEFNLNLGNYSSAIIGEQGSKSLGRGMRNLSNLKQLVLIIGKDASLSQNGGLSIAQSIENLTKLESINLQISEHNQIQSELMYSFTSALSQLRDLKKVTIELETQGHLKNPPFCLDRFQQIDSCIKGGYIKFQVDNNKLKCSLSLQSMTDLSLSLSIQDLLELEPNDILLPLQGLDSSMNIPISLAVTSRTNLLNENVIRLISTFQTSELTISISFNSQIDLVMIFQAISKIKNLRNLSLELEENQFNYHQMIQAFYQLSLNQSEQCLHSLEVIWFDHQEEEDKKLMLKIFKSISLLQNLKRFTYDFPFIESRSIQSALKRILKKKLNKLVHLRNQGGSDDDDGVDLVDDLDSSSNSHDSNKDSDFHEQDISDDEGQYDLNMEQINDNKEEKDEQEDFSDELNEEHSDKQTNC